MRGREMVKSTVPSGPAEHGIHHPEERPFLAAEPDGVFGRDKCLAPQVDR